MSSESSVLGAVLVRWLGRLGFLGGVFLRRARSASSRASGPPPPARRLLLVALRLALGARAAPRSPGPPASPRPRLPSGCCSSSRALVVRHQASTSIRAGFCASWGCSGAGVDLQLPQLLAREAVAGKHPLDRLADHLLGSALEHLAERARAQSAGIAAVAVVELVVELVPGDPDLGRIDHDHEVPGVAVRRVLRLALAAERVGDLGGEPAEGPALGVDHVPVALAVLGCGYVSLHLDCWRPGPGRTAKSRPHQPTRARPTTGRHAHGRGRRMIVERTGEVSSRESLVRRTPPPAWLYCRRPDDLPNPRRPSRSGAGEPKGRRRKPSWGRIGHSVRP